MNAIEVRGLRKSYGKQVVLDGIDLDVAEGSVFALLGPNGAGKTTAIHILSTLIAADGGEVRIGGHDVARDPAGVRGLIGLTGQISAVDGQFTGEENLRLMADLNHLGRQRGRQRVQALLERFDLADAAGKPASTYSGGMRRRLDLAMTLIGEPRIIFLDEPTTGLDPRSRRVMWEIVRDLVATGVTILLTTQYLEEADQLAGRIALLDGGRIAAEGTPAELKRLVPGGSVRLEFADIAALDRAATTLSTGVRDDQSLALDLASDGSVRSLRALLERLDDASIDVEGLSVSAADLDDVFLTLTGRRDGQEAPPAMTTYLFTDSTTMLRRSLRRMRRYPSLTFFVAAIPIAMLLLFVYVFGAALGMGIGGPSLPGGDGSRAAYVAYVVPGILLICVAGAAQGTAISVAMDMTAGIIARFRTMSIARASVLAGHVIGAVVQTMLATTLVVIVAVVIGFRVTTGPLEWVAAAGLLVLVAVAISWLSVALGMAADSVETASNTPFFLVLLPFISSGFVPAQSMPGPLGWFAEHQPFTPMIETLRGLLLGTPIGDSGLLALAWCAVISLGGYLWARRLYEKVPVQAPA